MQPDGAAVRVEDAQLPVVHGAPDGVAGIARRAGDGRAWPAQVDEGSETGRPRGVKVRGVTAWSVGGIIST